MTEVKSCCPPGSHPALKEDTSRKLDGVVSEVEGIPIYTVTPPEKVTKDNKMEGAAIVVIYDVYGFSGGRVKSFCDELAQSGAVVCMPDFYKPGGAAGVQDFGGFGNEAAQKFIGQFTFENLRATMDKVMKSLKDSHGINRIGIVGFCWGAWASFKFATVAPEYSLKCGVNCHPSLQIGSMFFSEEVDTIASAVKVPQMLMPAGGDPEYVKNGGSVPKILEANGLECPVTEYPDMQHGWTIRGDTADKAIARDVESAVVNAKGFFKKYLAM